MDGMPSVSQRGQDMPPSPIRKLLPFADKAKAAGTRVIHLNIGQPDIQAPEEFWTALAAGRPRVLEYSNSSGNPSLRKKMAAKYSSW
jgi:aspartate aminotransferase